MEGRLGRVLSNIATPVVDAYESRVAENQARNEENLDCTLRPL